MENQKGLVVRNGEAFVKPQNPLDPACSNWDNTIDERMSKLEERMMDLEVNLLDILKSMVDDISKFQKKNSDSQPDIEIKKLHLDEIKNLPSPSNSPVSNDE